MTEGNQVDDQSDGVASQLNQSVMQQVEEEKEQFRKSMSVKFNLKRNDSDYNSIASPTKSAKHKHTNSNALNISRMDSNS